MTEPHRSDPELVVLHALRCCGASSAERLGTMLAPLVDADVESVLLRLAGERLVTHDPGPFGGWALTAEGRENDAARIADELDRADAHSDVHAAYETFLPLNERTLDVCTTWQLRSRDPLVLNDHSDPDHDGRVLGRLGEVDAEIQPVCARLGAQLHRFSHYGPRLATAVDRARRGEVELVTSSLDSYHSVWFQLHEDLLVTLGFSRGA